MKMLFGKIKNKIQLSKIKRYKNIHYGEKCFVIGNGPSLKMEDLQKIQKAGFKTFACNRIYLAFKNTSWRPDYFCMSDQKLLKDMKNEYIDIPLNKQFYPNSKSPKCLKGNLYNTFFYDDWATIGRFSKDASEGIIESGSVTIEMIQLAYYMGFFEIYLVGVDFSYAVTEKMNNSTYVYQGENNYFIKDYLKKGEIADVPNIEPQLRGYEAARKEIEAAGRIIKNATRGGKLEVFERVDLDELFRKWENR